MTPAQFRRIVWNHYRTQGRHDLPWRTTHNPYRILVSEVMLQQTQVERVKPYYRAWLKQFPTVQALARAPLADVLTAWQGLGYNRRAKMLHEAAKAIASQRTFPRTAEALEKLPGIGPYTARAITAFAYNVDTVFIETNIRTAVTHHFFPRKKLVHDREVLAILTQCLPSGRSREWYAALMDYGAYLKRTGVRLNAKAKGYQPQKAFAGSDREARGAIVRALSTGSASHARIRSLLGTARTAQVEAQLARLLSEGMIKKHASTYSLP